MITLEPGTYIAAITNHRLAETRQNQVAHVALDVVLQGRIDPAKPTADPIPCPSTARTVMLWLTEKAAERTVSDLKAVGWKGTKLSQLDLPSDDSASMVGTVIYVTCYLDQDGDKIRENWSIARQRESLSAKRIAELEDKYGHLFEDIEA